MVTQKDLQDLVKALNTVLADLDKRVVALEEAAKQSSSTTTTKKVIKKT